MTLYEAHLKSQSIKDFEDKISYNEHHPHSLFCTTFAYYTTTIV